MDYEEFRSNFGRIGWYNIFVLILLNATGTMFYAANNYGINFIASQADHWCEIPELKNLTLEEQFQYGIPWDEHSQAYHSCKMYSNYSTPSSTSSQSTLLTCGLPFKASDHDDTMIMITDCQQGWVYDQSARESTTKSQWDLVCDDVGINDLVTPLFVAGQFSGALVCGFISNMFGRKRSLVLWTSVMCVAGIAAACSINIIMFIVARGFLGAAGINTSQLGYMLGSELTPPEYREIAGTFGAVIHLFGILVTVGVAYVIREWRLYQFTIAVAPLPFLLFFVFLVPESPRWLFWQNRQADAASVLTRIAKCNGQPLTESNKINTFIQEKDESVSEKNKSTDTGSFKDLFTHPVTRRCTLTIAFSWMSITFTSYAVGLNVDNLSGNVYTNMCVMAILDMVAVLLTPILARRVGRIPTITGAFCIIIVTGTTAFTTVLLNGPGVIVTVCALIGRASSYASSNTYNILLLGLFPTSVRNLAMTFAYACCYLGGIAAPLVAGPLVRIWAPITYLIYTCLAVVSMLLALWLPETKATRIPETIEELENIKNVKKKEEKSEPQHNGHLNQAFYINETPPQCRISNATSSTYM